MNNADRAAYPNFEIYPGHVCGVEVVFDLSMSVHLPAVYPSLDICGRSFPSRRKKFRY